MPDKNRKSLGRGLDSILQSPETDITSKDISGDFVAGAIAEIDIDQIETNPFQPRTEFDETALRELAQSITDFSRDPALLRRVRSRVGDMIEARD